MPIDEAVHHCFRPRAAKPRDSLEVFLGVRLCVGVFAAPCGTIDASLSRRVGVSWLAIARRMKKEKGMNRQTALFTAAALSAVLFLPSLSGAGDAATKSLEALAAESATTPEQHEALAAYYRQKAESAREDVRLHTGMAPAYGNRSASAGAAMATHCNNLVKAAKAQVAEYEGMAAYHDAEAKKAGK